MKIACARQPQVYFAFRLGASAAKYRACLEELVFVPLVSARKKKRFRSRKVVFKVTWTGRGHGSVMINTLRNVKQPANCEVGKRLMRN